MELMIETQYWVNYGNADEPYWKPKGASDTIVLNVPEDLSPESIESIRDKFDGGDDFYMDSVTMVRFIEPGTYDADMCETIEYVELMKPQATV